ncbi:MAG TPA: tetratricopeptide repeat protein [Steroidobacteraceae bacterium]|jgi:tetratricopeptide (TPR) repeat protein
MPSYSVGDVERVLRLSRGTIRSLIEGGFVKPDRGPRREYRFSFQDLIVLRTARALIQAKVPRKRILTSLAALRQELPDSAPLSGLNISAVGDRVVVRDGKSHRHVESGQYLLGLEVTVEGGVLHVVEHKGAAQNSAPNTPATRADAAATPKGADDWFGEGLELESTDPHGALRAYEHAVKLDQENTAAWINWGRLLHERGDTKEADAVYKRALDQVGPDALLLFNRGVLLEDLGKTGAALEAYKSAVTEDPTLADGHYNLARLYESLGKSQHAIRHLGQYRRLVTSVER